MAQQIKALAPEPDDLDSIPRIHMTEKELVSQSYPWTFTHSHTNTHTYTHKHARTYTQN